jgi:glycosyltransferase involved in cell wall biosynthesis
LNSRPRGRSGAESSGSAFSPSDESATLHRTAAHEGSDGDRPVLSILMPSYNSSRHIEETIRSVLAVEAPELELVIQDGQSTDDTQEIVALIDDPRIRFIAEADDGQSDALNRALARARGEWIGWLNADDLYLADGVARLAESFNPSLDFVYGDYRTIDEKGHELGRYRSSRPFSFKRLLRYGMYINCSAGFYRADVLRGNGGWDPEIDYVMDWDLLLRLAKAEVRSQYVPVGVQCLRRYEEAKSSRYRWDLFREGWRVAVRQSSGVPWSRPLLLMGQSRFFFYMLTRRIWKSALWRRIRPSKRL